MGKLIAACLLVMFIFVGVMALYGVGIYNRYIDIELSYEKQMAKLETFHDKMWKTIKSQAKITDKYKDGFNEVYTNIMQGRYSGGSKDGSLMKWIQEQNPQFNSSMYEKMMTTVEAQRNGFFAEQDIMQGIVKEGNTLVRTAPTNLVCMLLGLKEFKFEPISSSVSKKVMETREDNDLYLGE